jgi:hypothetical protein
MLPLLPEINTEKYSEFHWKVDRFINAFPHKLNRNNLFKYFEDLTVLVLNRYHDITNNIHKELICVHLKNILFLNRNFQKVIKKYEHKLKKRELKYGFCCRCSHSVDNEIIELMRASDHHFNYTPNKSFENISIVSYRFVRDFIESVIKSEKEKTRIYDFLSKFSSECDNIRELMNKTSKVLID